MVQQKIELKPDVVLKQYWNDNEHFADFFNAVLFQGEAVIKSQDLCDVDSQETTVVENKKMMKSMQMTRDVVKPFVNDYKMQLVEARKNKLHFHNINNQDLFQLLAILLNNTVQKDLIKQAAIAYTKEHKVDKSVVITAAGAANCKLDYSQMEAKGEVDMCTVFEETWQDGLNEGLEQGVSQGENNLICKLYQNGMSVRDIVILTGLTEKRIQEALQNGQ